MRDQTGRTIDYMRISITDRCNLRCRYCMPYGVESLPMRELLTYEEIEEVCRQGAALGIRHLKVTGGEPLVRKGCCGLMGRLLRIQGIEAVTVTTNGILLKENLDGLLEAGVRAVNVSLDTLDRAEYEAITGFDGLERVLSGIEAACRAGLQVKINAVSVDWRGDGNGCFRELAGLAKDYPVDVRFIEMMPIGYGKQFKTIDHRTLIEAAKREFPGIQPDDGVHGYGPAVYFRVPGFQGGLGFISAIHGKFCAGCNRVRLTSTGYLKPCLCYESGTDLRSILRGPDFTGDQLRRAMEAAIYAKPQAHCFERPEAVTETGNMIQIGG